MDARRTYEREVLRAFAKPGVACDTLAREGRARRRLEAAVREMEAAIAQVNRDSEFVRIGPQAFADFLADECPAGPDWDEKISAAKEDRD